MARPGDRRRRLPRPGGPGQRECVDTRRRALRPDRRGNDVPEEIWFLAQTPWVLLHGHNPLANDWLNAPVGVNLMDNTTMPLLGIVGFPITVLFGPTRPSTS